MGKVLWAEFYKSMHDRILLLLTAATFFLFLFFWNGMNIRSIGELRKQFDNIGFRAAAAANGWTEDLSEGETEETIERFFSYYIEYSSARMLREYVPILFFSIYASAYLIGRKFTQRTVNSAVCQGYSRLQFLFASLLHYILIIAITLCVTVFLFLFFKFGGRCFPLLATMHFWRNLGLWIYLATAAMMLQFAAAFLIRNLFGTLLANFILMLVVAVLPTSSFRGEILSGRLMDFYPVGIMEKEALWLPGTVLNGEQTLLLITIPLAIIVCSAAAAHIGFRKCNLK